MRTHGDCDQRVARRAAAISGATLAAQAQGLAICCALRNFDAKGLAIGQGDAGFIPKGCLQKTDFKRIANILTRCHEATLAKRVRALLAAPIAQDFRKYISRVRVGTITAALLVSVFGVIGEIAVVLALRALGTSCVNFPCIKTRAGNTDLR